MTQDLPPLLFIGLSEVRGVHSATVMVRVDQIAAVRELDSAIERDHADTEVVLCSGSRVRVGESAPKVMALIKQSVTV